MNTVSMKLVGEDGNAFAILGRFKHAAKRSGWNDEQIDVVMKEAMSSDYNHLLATIIKHVEEPDEDDNYDLYEENEA